MTGWFVRCVGAVLGAMLVAGAGPEPEMEAKVRAFLERPEQIAEIKAALEAKAQATPNLCSELTVEPELLFLKMPPAPRFDASGTMIEGSVRQRFASSGCGAAHPLFNIWVIASPGQKTRTVAAYSGTTTAFIDLQESATPTATVAAGRVLGGCGSLDVVDTRELGADPATGEGPPPWRELWLISGCGMFAQVGLRFVPDPAHRRTRVEAPPEAVRKINVR